MRIPQLTFTFLALSFLIAPVAATGSSATGTSFHKTLTLDGEAVHDNGAVGLNVTNFGLIGSKPGTGLPFSSAPSLRFPLPDGADHLFAAGVWVGGITGGAPHVSTGQYTSEFIADPDDPKDTIYASFEGAAGGLRLPGVADDDGDGLVDEDPLNGFDDDGDGAIDEDYAAIGDQYFHARMRDDVASVIEVLPDHVPLGIKLQQESFSWSDGRVDDLVGFRYTIQNVGDQTIDDVYVGLLADLDMNGFANDDLFGYESSSMVSELSPDPVDVQLVYQYDAGSDGPYAGMVLLNHMAADGRAFSGAIGMQGLAGAQPFSSGGDPTNDVERYDLLSRSEFDTPPSPSQVQLAQDYRVFLNAGPFGQLAPGSQVVFEFAFVVGEDLDQLRANAANAVALARGQDLAFDGNLVRVPWLLPQEQPMTATLSGHWSAVGAKLRVGRSADFPIQLLRLNQVGLAARAWSNADAKVTGPWLRFVDDDRGPWPRVYVVQVAGRELARTQVDRPGKGRHQALRIVSVSPNPFNPQTELRFVLDQPSETSVEIFNSRGQRVRVLQSGSLDAGEQRIRWDGNDAAGHPASTGIYFFRVSAGDQVVTQRAALVR